MVAQTVFGWIQILHSLQEINLLRREGFFPCRLDFAEKRSKTAPKNVRQVISLLPKRKDFAQMLVLRNPSTIKPGLRWLCKLVAANADMRRLVLKRSG